MSISIVKKFGMKVPHTIDHERILHFEDLRKFTFILVGLVPLQDLGGLRLEVVLKG